MLLAGGPLLLGLDQPRDPALLEAAYDDAAGVSKAFAFNLLKRLNRDLQRQCSTQQLPLRGPLAGRSAAHRNGSRQSLRPDHPAGRVSLVVRAQ